jgi:hypothetical protein
LGSYSILQIDRLHFEWKYDVPTFLAFLFRDEDYASPLPRRETDAEQDEYRRQVGYHTTVDQARQRLEDVGLTLEFFSGVYDTLTTSIDAKIVDSVGALETLGEHVSVYEARARGAEFLAKAADLGLMDQLEVFLDFLREAVDTNPPPAYIHVFGGEASELMIDAAEMASDLVINPDTTVHPAVVRIANLFAEDSDCPIEIQELLLARLALEIVPTGAAVELDLTQFWDEVEGPDLSGEPSRLAEQLVTKVQLYNRTFAALATKDSDLGQRIVAQRIKHALQLLDRAVSRIEKGRSLEALMETIFASHPSFVVANRALNLGDEEIDLVVRNHVDDPFWQALRSPLILVECKNWTAPVGTKEVRDFETKLRDHPLAQVGIFVALNGFTGEVKSALLRAEREGYHICTITRTQIERLITEDMDVIEWLTAEFSALR